MTRNNLDNQNCSVAQALEIIGEWWTILILREAFFGTRRFEDFQQHLNIARNILTTRLRKLCEHGILTRVPVKEGAKRHEYRLTPMGKDLIVVVVALTQWGDRWLHSGEGAPVIFCDRETGEPIADVDLHSKDGRHLIPRQIMLKPGPGANIETQKRLQEIAKTWKIRQALHDE